MTVARHSRTFPARRDALPQVDAFLGEVCVAAGLGRETCLRLTLLVEELFTNTVVHGHGADSEAPVRLECEVSPGRLGVLLVRAMAQQVEYRRAGDRNLISLVISTIA